MDIRSNFRDSKHMISYIQKFIDSLSSLNSDIIYWDWQHMSEPSYPKLYFNVLTHTEVFNILQQLCEQLFTERNIICIKMLTLKTTVLT